MRRAEPRELSHRWPETASELNVEALSELLERGAEIERVELLADGLGLDEGPLALVALRLRGVGHTLPVGLGPRGRGLLRRAPGGASEAGSSLREELAARLRECESEDSDERASLLVDWMLDRTKATRCALVPFEAGALAEPIVLRLRGAGHDMIEPRHVPRRVVATVARTRRPLGSHECSSTMDQGVTDPQGTIARQRVRAWWAIPVVFRGELLAVAHVDRLDGESEFTSEERAALEAFAYELARPLLAVQEKRRRVEYEGLRDLLLSRGEACEPSSDALESVLEAARRLAPHAGENLLVLGETGVGKEWLARRIHALSGRAGPFVAVNVSAIPPELFESELTGAVRGAYTGAVDRPGRVVEAEGGTLFLDEIGDLAADHQVKLLRLLEGKSVRPVGGRAERTVDVRFIAATNRDLSALQSEGAFRSDLLHRFAPPLTVPPLRERREEILGHAAQWLESKVRETGLAPARLDGAARDYLLQHDWPGNLRQLRAVVGHALLLADGGGIGRELLESLAGGPPGAARAREAVASPSSESWESFVAWRDRKEREWLAAALERHGGNVGVTARAIGCPRTSLRRLIRRHRLGPASDSGTEAARSD